MHVRLIAVGRLREPYVAAAADDFRTRLRPYHRLEEIEVRASEAAATARGRDEEAEAVLRHVGSDDVVWLLERSGTQLTSEGLAARIERVAREGRARLVVVVAGTFGAAPALLARASFLWSLSELTFLHEWARIIVLEQLYRAAKIARNEPYHH